MVLATFQKSGSILRIPKSSVFTYIYVKTVFVASKNNPDKAPPNRPRASRRERNGARKSQKTHQNRPRASRRERNGARKSPNTHQIVMKSAIDFVPQVPPKT